MSLVDCGIKLVLRPWKWPWRVCHVASRTSSWTCWAPLLRNLLGKLGYCYWLTQITTEARRH
jgi:hypothetical protein